MAHIIVKQPDGKFAIWSTIVDNFLLENASEKEVFKYEISCAMDETEAKLKAVFEKVENNNVRFSYQDAIKRLEEIKIAIDEENE